MKSSKYLSNPKKDVYEYHFDKKHAIFARNLIEPNGGTERQ